MHFKCEVSLESIQILLQKWIIDWVENDENEEVNFVSVRFDIDFKLLPLCFDV